MHLVHLRLLPRDARALARDAPLARVDRARHLARDALEDLGERTVDSLEQPAALGAVDRDLPHDLAIDVGARPSVARMPNEQRES